MNKRVVWVLAIVAILVVAGGAWWAASRGVVENTGGDKQVKQQVLSTSAADFMADYPGVAADNRFVYADADAVLGIFEGGSGLVFLGFKECPWCQQLAPIVDEAAKAEGLGQIYYLDIREAREANNETYQKLVAKLGDHLEKDEDGQPRIFVPDVTAVSGGEIVGRFEQEPSEEGENPTPDTYWTAERRERGVSQVRDIISKIQLDFAAVESAMRHGATLLDVRSAQEFKAGHFAGAVNLDVVDIERGRLPEAGKGEAIYLYCRSGNRSAVAKEMLENAGYTNIIDLGGLGGVEAMGGKMVTI